MRVAMRLLVACAILLSPFRVSAQEVDPIEVFGSLARFQFAMLAPDGVQLAFVIPRDDGEYVGIVNLEDTTQEMRGLLVDGNVISLAWLTNDRVAISYRVSAYYWGANRDSYRAVIVSDEMQGVTVTLGPHVAGEDILDYAPDEPGAAYIGAWSPTAWDEYSIYRLNPASGAAIREYRGNRDTARWVMDGSGNIAARIDVLDRGERDAIFVPDGGDGFRQIGIINDTPENSGFAVGLAGDASSLAVLSRRGGYREGLYTYDLLTGEWDEDPLFLNPDGDVVNVIRDHRNGRIVGSVYFENGAPKFEYFFAEDEELRRRISEVLGGRTINITSRSADGDRVLLAASSPTHPPESYVFVISSGQLVPLGGDFAGVENLTLGETRPHSYVGSDGVELTGFLTLPPIADAGSLPAVVMPSGGNAFERFDFDVLAHFLALKGYAVFRAGQRQNLHIGDLYEAGKLEAWVQTTHDDMGRAIASLADDGVIDEDRVCILGTYDNGFLAVIGTAIRPDQYACAVNLFGVLDLPRLMRWYSHVRNPTTFFYSSVARHWNDFDDDELERVTPINRANEIGAPLLLVALSWDRYRPPYLGVEDLVRALRRQDKEIVSIDYDDQAYAENRQIQKDMFREIDNFLDAHIGR